MRERAGFVLGLVVLYAVFAATPARADSLLGPFAPFNGWWVHPTAGTLGIFWDGSFIRIDRDGSFVTLDAFTFPPALRDVDPDTQEVIVPDLGAAFPGAFGWGQVLVDEMGAIYVAPNQPGLGVVQRMSDPTTETLIPFGFGAGQIQDMAMVSLPVPEPGTVALLAALAVFVGRVGLRRACRPKRLRGS